MTNKSWIQIKLIENDFNKDKVYKLYDTFREETHSEMTIDSYKRKVRQYYKDFKLFAIMQVKNAELIEKYPKNILLEILEKEIKTRRKILTVEDLNEIAKEHDIPLNVFFQNVPDLMNIIKSIYVSLGFSLKYDIEITKLKQKVKELESEKKILINQKIQMENVLDGLFTVAKEYEPYDKPIYIKKGKKEREGAICLSDTHFDEIVKLSETHNLNHYTPDIAKERLDILFNEVLEWCKELKIDILHIKFLGDMVSGIIHQELLTNTELGVTHSVIRLADYLSQWIKELSKYLKIYIIGMVGNHGRFFKQPFYKQKQVLNFDYILYEFIKREVKQIVKDFVIPDSFFYVNDILGYKFLTLHGDIFKGGTGLNPVSGTIGRDIAKLNGILRANGMEFDYAEFGHFHHGESILSAFDGTVVFMNGSLIGVNEYALGKVKRADRPSQNFYVVEKGKGVLFKTAIYVDGK